MDILAPILLVILRLIQGFAVGGEISGASAMILEHSPFGKRGYCTSFTLQGCADRPDHRSAIFLPPSGPDADRSLPELGLADPVFPVRLRGARRLHDPAQCRRDPGFADEAAHGEVPQAPIVQVVKENCIDMVRVVCMALMNAMPGTGRFDRDGCGLVGRITFGVSIIAAIACFSAHEAFRAHINDLGSNDAVPVPKDEYDRIRQTGVDQPA